MIIDHCEECKYFTDCPCGYSLHNAACLTIATPFNPVEEETTKEPCNNEKSCEK